MSDTNPPTHPTTVLQNLLRHVREGLVHVGAHMWLVADVSPEQIAADATDDAADPAAPPGRPDPHPMPRSTTGPRWPRPL